jgi:hypothetical protein
MEKPVYGFRWGEALETVLPILFTFWNFGLFAVFSC